MKDIYRNCPFCGREHRIPQKVGKGILCLCGAYGQTDDLEDAYLFPEEAARFLGVDEYHARELLEIRDGGVVLEGDDEDPFPIVIQWAKRKSLKSGERRGGGWRGALSLSRATLPLSLFLIPVELHVFQELKNMQLKDFNPVYWGFSIYIYINHTLDKSFTSR